MISNQIPQNSPDKNHFNKVAPDWNIALKNKGFNNNITYIKINKSVNPKQGKLFGPVPNIVLMWKLTLTKFLRDWLIKPKKSSLVSRNHLGEIFLSPTFPRKSNVYENIYFLFPLAKIIVWIFFFPFKQKKIRLFVFQQRKLLLQ